MDGGDPALSASTDVTITVNDVNEAPEVVEGKELDDQYQMAGDTISWTVDLTGVFTDEDDDDSILAYSVSDPNGLLGADNKAIDLEITVTRGVDDDGEATVTGVITSTKAINAAQQPNSFDVSIVATDDDDDMPMSGQASFTLVVDDRNDAITAINLYHLNEDGTDGEANLIYVVDVDENHDGEVNFGRITVEDDDSGEHPHGMHTVTVDAASKTKGFEIKVDDEGGFWLVKKAGVSLDHEEYATHTVTITAKDMVKNAAGKLVANTVAFTETVSVDVNDRNDVPKAIEKAGNWWVTVDEDLEAEDVTEGQWLTFQLETDGDNAAFTDKDEEGDNGELTYEITSGPSWLDIKVDEDDDSIVSFVNKAKMLPPEAGGKFMVTVEATDGGDESATFSFYLTVAVSGADNEDNDDPSFRDVSSSRNNVYTENAGEGVVVATFTVEDEDSHLTGHPFAPGMPTITAVVNSDDAADTNNNDDTSDDADTGPEGYAAAFELERVGTSNTWRIVTTDDAEDLLNHEDVDDIQITVTVSDGAGGSDEVDINVNIDDAREAPVYGVSESSVRYASSTSSVTDVGQTESDHVLVWINLNNVWDDPDDNQDSGDLTFRASSNSPWITILQAPEEWEIVQEGKDDDDADDDWTWGGHPDYADEDPDQVYIGEGGDSDEPEDDEYVMLVRIDRTKANNLQADVADGGSFTLTATDPNGNSESREIMVPLIDENVPIGDKAVTLTGTPREGIYLTANFDETRDPDLAGDADAYLVLYTFSAVVVNADGTDGAATVRQVGTSNQYMPTQDDVDRRISVSVSYRELEADTTADTDMSPDFSDAQTGATIANLVATTTDAVLNTPDRGKVPINILVNEANNGLIAETAEVRIFDEDGIDTTADSDPDTDDGTPPVYTWQESVNGASGWVNVVVDPADDTSDLNLALAAGGGKYYRLVVTYTDEEGVAERHVSDSIQVGTLKAVDTDDAASISGSAVVGGTLRVDAATGATVAWQRQVDPDSTATNDEYWETVSTGNTLSLTADYNGAVLRAVVTTSGTSGVTDMEILSVVDGSAITVTGPLNTAPTKVKDHEIEVDALNDGVTTVDEMVPVASLFEDLDGDTLTFTAAPGTGAPADTADTSGAEYVGGNDQGLISFDASTGHLVYVTDEAGGHDGSATDGEGNVITFVITADDGNGGTATANVNIRLNVKPTEVAGSNTATVAENDQAPADLITDLNVQDENLPTEDFGKYKWTIKEGDARFKITANMDDSSQAVLAVLAGQKFEADGEDAEITLTLVATEVGNPEHVIEHKVTITVTNDDTDDTATADLTDVPGLKDNEDGDDNDLEDATGDDDIDGGWVPPTPPPDPGMMVIDDDLLDSFVLAIDDIDVA